MTCIVGLEHDGIVTLGGDSGAFAAGVVMVRQDRKVWAHGRWAFGCAGSFRHMQLLRHRLELPDAITGDVDEFMVGKFIDHIRDALHDGGHLATNQQGQQSNSGTILVAYLDRLYTVYGDFSIERVEGPYASVGAGREVAWGAMYAADPDTPAEQRILTALAAADYHRSDVRGPYHLVRTARRRARGAVTVGRSADTSKV